MNIIYLEMTKEITVLTCEFAKCSFYHNQSQEDVCVDLPEQQETKWRESGLESGAKVRGTFLFRQMLIRYRFYLAAYFKFDKNLFTFLF